MARSRIVGAAAAALTLPLLLLVPLPSANAESKTAAPAAVQAAPGQADDIRELTRKDFTFEGKPVQAPASYQPRASLLAEEPVVTPPVGTTRRMLALDDFNGIIYRKDYVLRGAGTKIEVWVATDTTFPAGDCRNSTPGSTEITDAHVASLINEFDNNMFPKETAAFSTPPDRDGTNALIAGDFTGAGDKTVALIDNVRDANFFNFPAASDVHRGLLLLGLQRVHGPQCHDHRRVSTGCTAPVPTRRTTRRPTRAPAAPAGRTSTRACSRMSGSTC